MMYPYMTLADETEIIHSQIIEKDGMEVKVPDTIKFLQQQMTIQQKKIHHFVLMKTAHICSRQSI